MNEIGGILLSGFSIGILGSFHCVGMCGPLALSLPIQHLSGFYKFLAILFYNFGRAITYASMGIVIGLIGQSFALFNIQRWLSVVSGVILLSLLLFHKLGNPNSNKVTKFSQTIKQKLGVYLKSDKNLNSYLLIGLLNGFLPCGLVYVAIAVSISTSSVLGSSLLMFAFGLGTIPIMALTMGFGKFISLNLRNRLNKISPYLIMCVALLLIVRGLNLGIPYISPSHNAGEIICCHK